MNASDDPTQPICRAQTILRTTDHLLLPAGALQLDASLAGAGSTGATAVREAPALADVMPNLAVELADHEFVACVERGPLGEVWKVRTPEGKLRLAHHLHGTESGGGGDEWLGRLLSLSHPLLPALDVGRGSSGCVVLLADAPDRSLNDWFRECRSWNLPGVPRSDLVRFLKPVAHALDELYERHRLQHLGLHPGSLQLKKNKPRIDGFGLVPLLGLPSGRPPRTLNPNYCAPELLDGRVTPGCDQYSLALICAEMLTGVHPLHGIGGRRPAGAGRYERPELGLLASADREVVARALDPDAQQRFGNCARFVAALEASLAPEESGVNRRPELLPPLLVASPGPAPAPRELSSLDQFIRALLALAVGPQVFRDHGTIRYHLEAGQALRHRCAVSLFPGAALLRLEGFRQKWGADAVPIDRECLAFTVSTSLSLWERLTGQQVGLEIQVRMTPPARTSKKLSEVSVLIRPYGCGPARAVRLLEETGPVLLESLREHLQALPEQRGQERVLWNQPLRVIPVVGGSRLLDAIDCMGKDISRRGIGFFLPEPLDATHFYVNHPALLHLAPVAGLAKVVRGQRSPDGWYEVGALFTPEGPIDGLGRK